jgi:hypothetical protein
MVCAAPRSGEGRFQGPYRNEFQVFQDTKMNRFTLALTARLVICAGWVSLVACSQAATNSPASDDLVSFFKQAITSPPDVEDFVGSARTLRVSDLPASFRSDTNFQAVVFYQGARAGTNFFLRRLNDRALAPASAPPLVTVGRETTNIYEVNRTTITYGIGNSPIAIPNSLSFNLLCHFLDMGLIELRSETVEWQENQFRAVDTRGARIFGKLEISNSLPASLKIAGTETGNPDKVYLYSYPEPATALGGFPGKVTILTQTEHGLAPLSEFELSSVRLAPEHLQKAFFTPLRFTGPTIIQTNLYSNADLYVSLKNGKMMKVGLGRQVPPPVSHVIRRFMLFILIATSVVVPIAIFLKTRKQEARTDNDRQNL